MKCMNRITKTLLGGGLGLLLGLALAGQAAAVTVTVDFDALDTSGGPVSGATLDAFLAGFGITLTIPAGGGGVPCLRTRRCWVAPIMSSLLPNPTSWNRLTEQLLVE